MIIYGGIPDKITYVVTKPHKVTRGWHGIDDLWIADPVEATPAFPVDLKSKSSMETAESWATGWRSNATATKVECDNAPIKSVQLLTIEVRHEGGRAYKVRLDNVGDGTLYVDMREDVVLDAMLVNGVKKGGTLVGPFVWGRFQSQLRLVRVGSTLHKAMLDAASRMAEKPIGPKDWVVGGVYLTRKLEAMVYLGPIDTDVLEHETVYEYGRARPGPKIIERAVRGVPHWFELKHHGDGIGDVLKGDAVRLASPEHWLKVWERGYEAEHCWVWGLKDTKKPVVIRHVATVTIDWPRLQNAAVAHAHRAAETDHYIAFSTPESVKARAYEHFVNASALAHARPAGQPKPSHLWRPELTPPTKDMNMNMNKLTFDVARSKYNFDDLVREDYTHVREVPPDENAVGALFAYAPPKEGFVTVDMYITENGRAELGVGSLNCPINTADAIVDSISEGDIERLLTLSKEHG